MTTTILRSRAAIFVRHYAEMVLAMMIGMFVLGGALTVLLEAAGIDVSSWSTEAPALELLGMALTMSVPMAAWMRYRGHDWAPVTEMTASMVMPSLAAVALLWAGTVEDHGALMAIQHAGMFAGMFAVMLLRIDEYTGHGHH